MFERAKLSAAIAALMLAVCGGQPAQAAVKVIDFTLTGPWQQFRGFSGPYGLSSQPTITGSVEVDDTKTDASAFLAIDFTTGTKSWGLADLLPDSRAFHAGGSMGFYMRFSGALVSTHASAISVRGASINDVPNGIYCSGCVRIDAVRDGVAPVPEPATWALSILGFGAVGAILRRRPLAAVA
jgi:hypothetical protein